MKLTLCASGTTNLHRTPLQPRPMSTDANAPFAKPYTNLRSTEAAFRQPKAKPNINRTLMVATRDLHADRMRRRLQYQRGRR